MPGRSGGKEIRSIYKMVGSYGNMENNHINPVTRLDYPDPDVIRVDDTYYMVSTTMHFMPGCEILRSYDLRNWEHVTYVYDRLDSTPGQRLEGEENIYGKGMWAASLRCHKGTYYICFVANDTHRTYLYTADCIEGPWKKRYVEGFYHDCSLLFDDDDRVYIAYGNKDIYITDRQKEDCTVWLSAMKGTLSWGMKVRIFIRFMGNIICFSSIR